jgi:uncharacterized protein (DUF433 family)
MFLGDIPMLQTLSNTGSRHIARHDDAFMKEPIVIGTNVFVRDIVEVWRSGVAPESIPAQLFDLVSAAQVFDAIGFYLDNQVEIDGHIAWYQQRPIANVPARLRLNPLRDEVEQSIQDYRRSVGED